MLKSYEAIYDHGQLHWLHQAPQKEQRLHVLVVIEEIEPKPLSFKQNIQEPSDDMLISEYKDKLTKEQIALFSKLMGAWKLTDSATTNPYDYPES
jgi:hypothetical protein